MSGQMPWVQMMREVGRFDSRTLGKILISCLHLFTEKQGH